MCPENEEVRDPAADWGGTAEDWNGTDGAAREWGQDGQEGGEPEDEDEDMGSNMSIEDCGGCRKLMSVVIDMSMEVKGLQKRVELFGTNGGATNVKSDSGVLSQEDENGGRGQGQKTG